MARSARGFAGTRAKDGRLHPRSPQLPRRLRAGLPFGTSCTGIGLAIPTSATRKHTAEIAEAEDLPRQTDAELDLIHEAFPRGPRPRTRRML